jgi:glutamyl-tRNA synthetase
MTTRIDIAAKIYPDITQSIADLQAQFPARANPTRLPDGQVCTRFAPSPTGFLHIGGIYTSFVSQKFARQSGGTFILRIEDTDQKREVEGAVQLIIDNMRRFGISIDEGPIGDHNADIGAYAPYTQSQRKHIYHVFAKHLIAQGLAYPCWMSETGLETIREQQTKTKVTPGIYGNYSLRRNKSPEECLAQLEADPNFVIRFRSHGDLSKRIVFDDVIKGKIEMIDNYNDIVLIKSDGLPTYHLAHIADDHLMRVSHIIRAEERLTSVPLHLQLFKAFDLVAPIYCHVAPLLKLDDGNKRKLSKRHDPEADIGYFFQEGYATQGIIEYLINIVDSKFEDRQKANPEQDYHDFEIHLEDMSKAGSLFDLTKLRSVNNAYLSKISTEQLYTESLAWAQTYQADLATLMLADPAYTQAALGIERHTMKDPKRFTTYADVSPQIRFFYDSERERLRKDNNLSTFNFQLSTEDLRPFIEEYKTLLDLTLSTEDRFAQLKEIGKKYGFAGNNAEFKE